MRHTSAELERILERQRTTRLICSELNNLVDLKPALFAVLRQLKELIHCEAAAIRLHDDGDYPYYVYDGFPESFIELENSLYATGVDGERIPSRDGKGYLLECMCGSIIRGRFDPSLRFFTEGGSFWSNTTTSLLASTREEERRIQPRKTCHSWGYESMALIPIKARGETIGLIQLNDKRIGVFTAELIHFVEMIAEQIGLAVQNSLTHSRLEDALEEIKALRGSLPMCVSCRSIRDDDGRWRGVEAYSRDRIETQFFPSLCPDCLAQLCGDVIRGDAALAKMRSLWEDSPGQEEVPSVQTGRFRSTEVGLQERVYEGKERRSPGADGPERGTGAVSAQALRSKAAREWGTKP